MLIQGFFSFYLIILTFAYVCVCVCVCVCTLYTHASKHSLRKLLIFGQNVFCTVVSLILLKRKKIGDNKKDMPFLLV
jgi:D-alanyl-lipoteichoic acid acyltransferase DltB (MBOAT superfamily)